MQKTVEELKIEHDKLQEGLPTYQMCIREGIVVNVGEGAYDDFPRYGFQFGCFRNPDMVKEIDCFIEYAKDKKCLLDIGAYHALFSHVFLKINTEGVAFAIEPYGKPFMTIRKFQVPNMLASQIAFSDYNGELVLWTYDDHLVSDKTSEEQKRMAVKCVSGDDFCMAMSVYPDIIKCDSEGMELKVLKGLEKQLSYCHPTIFLEIHFERMKRNGDAPEELLAILTKYNYRFIDTMTNHAISTNDLLEKQTGEKRIICL